MHFPPGFQRAVAARLPRFEIAVGEVQLPVGLLRVADEIPHARLEIGQRDVGIDAGQEHAAKDWPAIDIIERIGAGDAVVGHTRSLQQRLVECEVVVGGEG